MEYGGVYLFIYRNRSSSSADGAVESSHPTNCMRWNKAREMCVGTSMEVACSYWNLLPVGDHPGSERRPVVAAPSDEHHPASIIFETIQLTINHI